MRFVPSSVGPWLAIVTLTAAGAAAAAGYGLTAPKRYHATAQLLVTPVPAGDSTYTGLDLLRSGGKQTAAASAAALLRSPQVADAVRAQLGLTRSRDDLLSKIDARPVDDSDVVAITVEDTSAAGAAQLANAFADALVSQRTASFQSQLTSTIRHDEQLLRTMKGVGADELRRRLAVLRSLQGQPDPTLRSAGQASAPASAYWPKLPKLVGIGAGIGFAGGLLVALIGLVGRVGRAGRTPGTPEYDRRVPERVVDELEGRLQERVDALVEEGERLARREAALAQREREIAAQLDELRAALPKRADGEELARREQELEARVAALTRREVELARRAGELAAREQQPAERDDAALSAREQELEARVAAITRREVELARRAGAVAARERELAELPAREEELAERVAALTQREVELARRAAAVAEAERELAERTTAGEGELSTRAEELDARVAALTQREVELARRAASVAEAERELAERTEAAAVDGELSAREQELAARVAAVTQREIELARRVAAVAAREAEPTDEDREEELAAREAAVTVLEQEFAAAASAAGEELAARAEELAERDAVLEAREHEAAWAAPAPAAEPEPAVADGARGRYNLTLLERLVEERGAEFPDRLDEWSSYLYFLREYAAADGSVPASFDWLILDTFSEIVA